MTVWFQIHIRHIWIIECLGCSTWFCNHFHNWLFTQKSNTFSSITERWRRWLQRRWLRRPSSSNSADLLTHFQLLPAKHYTLSESLISHTVFSVVVSPFKAFWPALKATWIVLHCQLWCRFGECVWLLWSRELLLSPRQGELSPDILIALWVVLSAYLTSPCLSAGKNRQCSWSGKTEVMCPLTK